MSFFLYIGAFFIAVFVLIMVHEMGHLLVALLFQVKVERFSIGFGKPLYTWKSKNGFTEYVLAPLVFGGYVKLLDTRETKIPTKYHFFAFNNKPVLQRLAIISAGSLANIIFAFFAFWLMLVIGFKLPKPIIGEVMPQSIAAYAGMHANEEIIKVGKNATNNWSEVIIAMFAYIGEKGNLDITTTSVPEKQKIYQLDLSGWEINSYAPDPLLDFGLEQYKPLVLPIIYKISENSPAEKFGLKKGDRIVMVEGKKIDSWEGFLKQIKLYPNKTIKLLVNREGGSVELPVTTGWKFDQGWKKVGFLGVGMDKSKIVWPKQMLREYKYGLFSALPEVEHQMKLFINLNNIIIGKLLTGKISLHVLGGPIATFAASGYALEQGFIMFLGFLAIISLSIALINLLPLPGLDGGYLVLILIEAIRRHPISLRTQMLIFRLGMALLVLLILQTTANDLVRIFS